MDNLSLCVLGSFRASLGNEPLPGFRTHKVQALLVYLAIDPGPHKRESLMTLLWPGLPERSARGNLRQIIYLLRKIVPQVAPKDGDAKEGSDYVSVPLLIANRQSLQLNPAAAIMVDAIQLEEQLELTRSHDHLDLFTCLACHRDLEQAVQLYEGNFLEDFYLEDSNEFEEWAQARREFYRRKALDALETLTTIYSAQKEYPQARAFGERQLELDNLRESAYRQLMEVLALNGQRSEALAVYDNCHRILAEELAMEPAARTTQVYEQILAGDLQFGVPLTQGVRGYELKDEIGEGAYGAIRRAIQPSIGREVAVKVIRRKYANDPEFIRRFEAEAQIIAHLEHPYIVPLYDYWRDPEGAYLVMRYLNGGSLLSALSSGPWSLEQALKMLEQITSALSAAHCQGIIHRDIKPANILLDSAGNAYLSDFGVAKSLEGERQLTAEGAIIGSFEYISPEQILNEKVGPETDIYSLGAVLYETLTGEKPFPDVSTASLLYKHLNEPVPKVASSQPDLPPFIDDVIQKATAKRPVDRYADALEMAKAFRQAVQESDLARDVTLPEIFPSVEVYNPYKGLQAFQEADADDFFGRETLVEQLVTRMDPALIKRANGARWAEARFLAVVGPSGSGKSSVVKAGLIPALREGAIHPGRTMAGSDKWFVAEMVPGTHPLEELELALWPIAVDPPPSLVEPMQRDTRGLLRTIRRILPNEEGAQLLLVIDQFEELFTLVEDQARRTFFVDSLLAAIRAPRSPLRVVITLRADFYDRPLQYESLGRLLKENTEVVLPLTTEELTWAIQEPARRVGVSLERGLAPAIVTDVADQPGALPLLQYTLTELFERRQEQLMTSDAYQAIGGVLGVLGRRAEELYADLNESGREIARQLFLRLVTLGEGVEDTRRRVLRSEPEAIVAADGKQVAEVLDKFGQARLLTLDRDPISRQATVEVAHEALLREWPRLRRWLDENRDDIRRQRLLSVAASEWLSSDRAPGFLLREARLDQFTGWAEANKVTLTPDENAFLEASIAARQARLAEEEERRQRELEAARALALEQQRKAEAEQYRAEEQAQSANRIRRLASILAVVSLAAILLAVAAFLLFRQATQNEQLATSRELAAAALNNLEIDPELSVLLALEAVNVADTREAKNALHQAVPAMHLLHTIEGHNDSIEVMAISPNERWLASGAYDQAIKIWDIDSGTELISIDISGESARALAFSPEGKHLVTGGFNMPTNIWKLEENVEKRSITATTVLTLTGHTDAVMAAAYSPDGNLIATASNDLTARIWDAVTGEEMLLLAGHEQNESWIVDLSGLSDLAFSPDGSTLATAGADGTVRLWEIPSGQEILVIPGTGQAIYKVEFSPDGGRLATSGEDDTVKLWDLVSTPGDAHGLLSVSKAGNFSVTFSPDGQSIAVGGMGIAWILDVNTGREQLVLYGHSDPIYDLSFIDSGHRLVTISEDTKIKLWDTSPDHELLARFLGWPAYSPDGTQLAGGDYFGNIWIVDSSNGEDLLSLHGHSAIVFPLYSPDGKYIISASWDGSAKLWDATSGQELFTMVGHTDKIQDMAISNDGTRLATAGHDGSLRIWDLHDGRELLSIPASDWLVRAVDFSPNGKQVATVTYPNKEEYSIKIWDTASGELLHVQTIEPSIEIDYSPDGAYLAVSHFGGTTTIFDITKEPWMKAHVLTGHSSAVANVYFSPDGELLATGSSDGTARIWDAETGEEMLNLGAHKDAVAEVKFSPDGRHLVTLSYDGFTRIFTLDPEELVSLAQQRLTRTLSLEECRRFLHRESCTD